jgi:hypothetical protein
LSVFAMIPTVRQLYVARIALVKILDASFKKDRPNNQWSRVCCHRCSHDALSIEEPSSSQPLSKEKDTDRFDQAIGFVSRRFFDISMLTEKEECRAFIGQSKVVPSNPIVLLLMNDAGTAPGPPSATASATSSDAEVPNKCNHIPRSIPFVRREGFPAAPKGATTSI